ncbi:hypothetical protein [Methanobrevibacter sp.]|uniref:hypothetical protein n=1 Tax=Methanobrevibacter sp. TaxID=66852 RepID=UPI0025DB3152|nr:hypothetical protein [Methanobrevibacter sp.]MBQ2832380.1 hypothetical protein [Methanobrevibacter sp.]
MTEKENLYNRKVDIIFYMLVNIMRNQSNPLWKEYAEEYRAINKRLDELGIKEEDVTDYIEKIPDWMV